MKTREEYQEETRVGNEKLRKMWTKILAEEKVDNKRKKQVFSIDIPTLLSSPAPTLDDDHEWGYQVRMVNEDVYCKCGTLAGYCAKLLVLENDTPGSYHYHKIKDETFVVLVGVVEMKKTRVNIGGARVDLERTWPMRVGNVLNLQPFQAHQMKALEVPSVILEVSTHDDDGDIVKICD